MGRYRCPGAAPNWMGRLRGPRKEETVVRRGQGKGEAGAGSWPEAKAKAKTEVKASLWLLHCSSLCSASETSL